MSKYRELDYAKSVAARFDWNIAPELARLDITGFDNGERMEVQRDLDSELSAGMGEAFLPAVAAAVIVAQVPDGRQFVVDGQHRIKAACIAGHTWVWALVFHMPLQQAEALFILKNGSATRLARHIDILAGKEINGYNPVVNLGRILAAHECFIDRGRSRKDGGVYASVILQNIYDVDSGALLDRVLEVITESWGHSPKALRAEVLEGTALFLGHYGTELQAGQLRDLKATLKAQKGGIERILAAADIATKEQASVKRAVHVEYEILNTYNKKRTARRLTDRTSRQLAQLPGLSHLQLVAHPALNPGA